MLMLFDITGLWYKQFNYEPHPLGKEENLNILLVDTAAILLATTPIWALWMWCFPSWGICILRNGIPP